MAALDAGADIIGVNNRNLRTLAVDLDASEELIARMPQGVTAVSESGLKTPADLTRFMALGYRAFLIGERFMTTDDPGAALRDLLKGLEAVGTGARGYGARDYGGCGAPSRFQLPVPRPPAPSLQKDMFVKICGITRLEDAEAAVELGAGALGFVFWPKSPRFVDPERARAIVCTAAAVRDDGRRVRGPAAGLVNGVAARVGLGAVQLHGDETIDVLEHIERPVVKAFAIDGGDEDAWPARVRLLIDAHDPEKRGGTGRTVDWKRAAASPPAGRYCLPAG